MSTVIEEFVARLGWDIDNRQLTRFKKSVNNLKSDFQAMTKVMTVGSIALGFGFRKVMKSFSMVEDAQAAFQPVLGSIEKATELVEKLNDTAATTPFQFENLSSAAKQLLPNMGGDIENTIKTIRMLGDTAGGSSVKMQSIVRGYNKALLKGKVDMESLNMISEAGVPILKTLGDTMGVTGEKLFKNITAGKVSTEDLTNALKRMTGEGGMFFKGMEIASKTLTGRISTFKDLITLTLANIGTAFAPEVKKIVEGFIKIAEQVREWTKANKELLRQKFVAFVETVSSAIRRLISIGSFLANVIDKVGGLGDAFKILASIVAIIKFAPLLSAMGGLITSAPTLGAAFAAAGRAAAASWLPVGLALGVIFLAIDDIRASLRGAESFGGDIEQALGLSDGLHSLHKFIAELYDIDVDQLYSKLGDINPIFAMGFLGSIEHGFEVIFDALQSWATTLGELINIWILDPLFRAILFIPDKLVEGFAAGFNIVRNMLSKFGVNIPEMKGNLSQRIAAGTRPIGAASSNIGTGFSRGSALTQRAGRAVQRQSVQKPDWAAPSTASVVVQVSTNASPQRIAHETKRAVSRALDRARDNTRG